MTAILTPPESTVARPTVTIIDHAANRPDQAWARPAFVGLLAATALLYLWGLGASGWANSFYSAAAQAGAQSWKAWFFGSSDAANSITVDGHAAAADPAGCFHSVAGCVPRG